MKKVLIISYKGDVHLELVIEYLRKKKVKYFILNIDEYPRCYTIVHSLSNNSISATIKRNSDNEMISLEDISVVWSRKSAEFSYHSPVDDEEKDFLDNESKHALFGILFSKELNWINDPRKVRYSIWKSEQLTRAIRFGFNISPTIISNDPNKVNSFYKKNRELIYKPLYDDCVYSSKNSHEDSLFVATTILDEDMVSDHESISLVPNQIQAIIEKEFELRVYIINEKAVAFKLDTQKSKYSRLDSRNLNSEYPIDLYELTDDIKRMCLELTKSYGLVFSAIDIVYDINGKPIFLELNPNGQFRYYEQVCSTNLVSKFIAEVLTEYA